MLQNIPTMKFEMKLFIFFFNFQLQKGGTHSSLETHTTLTQFNPTAPTHTVLTHSALNHSLHSHSALTRQTERKPFQVGRVCASVGFLLTMFLNYAIFQFFLFFLPHSYNISIPFQTVGICFYRRSLVYVLPKA